MNANLNPRLLDATAFDIVLFMALQRFHFTKSVVSFI